MPSLLLINGSPRGKAGNSAILLKQLSEGWTGAGGEAPTVLHLARPGDFEQAVEAFPRATTVVIGMPLYTDAMPGLVMAFIERLEARVGRTDNPRLGFLVQSGFMEALHSRPLERYLDKLARRLGSDYAGTIVKGNGEAVRQMPEKANARLFGRLRGLGASLLRDDRFDVTLLRQLAGIERFGWFLRLLAPAIFALPIVNAYWNQMLKKNGAWERRDATPYA